MPDEIDVDLRSALLKLWDHTTLARPTWAFVEGLLSVTRRGQLVDAGLIEQDPEFSGCWRFTDRAVAIGRRFRADEFPDAGHPPR
jgi:hypothetical protein